jgi:4-oxalocrotonate tautomerase
MPIIHVHIMEGRTVDQKRRMVAEVTQAVARSFEVKPEAVRILIHELIPENYSLAGITARDQPLHARNRNVTEVDG